jgi:hypothetical protein
MVNLESKPACFYWTFDDLETARIQGYGQEIWVQDLMAHGASANTPA